MKLGWEPVTGARSYQVEVQCYVSDVWKQVLSRSVPAKTPSLRLRIDDIFHGRWRVKTIGDPGVESEVSEWRRFYYEIPRFVLQVPVQVLPVNNVVFNDPLRKTGFKWTYVPKATRYALRSSTTMVRSGLLTLGSDLRTTLPRPLIFPGQAKGVGVSGRNGIQSTTEGLRLGVNLHRGCISSIRNSFGGFGG